MIAIYVMKCDLFGRCHMWESFYFARLLSLCGEYTLSPILIDRIPWLLKLRKKAPMVFVSISKIIHKPYKMKQQKKIHGRRQSIGYIKPKERNDFIFNLFHFDFFFRSRIFPPLHCSKSSSCWNNMIRLLLFSQWSSHRIYFDCFSSPWFQFFPIFIASMQFVGRFYFQSILLILNVVPLTRNIASYSLNVRSEFYVENMK